MHRFLALLLIAAMLLGATVPALAQHGTIPDADEDNQFFLPLVSSGESEAASPQDTSPEQTVPAAPGEGDSLYFPLISDEQNRIQMMPDAPRDGQRDQMPRRLTHADRQAAANRAAALGFRANSLADQAAAAQMMGGAPYYFSVPNYANSPLPQVNGTIIGVGNPLVQRAYATDYVSPAVTPVPVMVVVPTAVLPDGLLKEFRIFNQTVPGGSPGPSAGNDFHGYVLRPTGNPNEYTVFYDSGSYTVPPPANPAGEVAAFPVPDIAVRQGDVIAFYGAGVPVDIVSSGTDLFSYPAPVAPTEATTITIGSGDYPLYGQARTYSFGAGVLDLSGANTTITGGLRKFVDTLPGLGPSGANNLGQYIPVAQADTTSYPGSDYYEIALVQYEEKMHSDLPPTKLRGYVQLSTSVTPGTQVALRNPDGSVIRLPNGSQAVAVDSPHYLGPLIAATKDRPVRILFRNLLPTGQGGDLFLPVDTTVMGSGMGPDMGGMGEPDPQNPMCGMTPKPADCFAENRGTLHLHGGVTPWISDGTPHQWITPANEGTSYPKGVSVQNVPDMPNPGPGAMTFFYTNQQSARLMFYHDHAWGITRLNVYAGEAAAYLITDTTEQSLISQGLIPDSQIPLVIQDKTFVPSEQQLMVTDPTWDTARWGGFGQLWLPHVYVPAQNPGDSSGVNQFGRWAYGPWFWPPTTAIDHGPMANPYFDPNCDPDEQWCEPELMPGTPYVSMGMESFHDTPLVNGTAYPTLSVEPKSYRLRILNAANDRFFNLSLYQADASGTEVALNAAEVAAALDDPTVFPTPDTALSPAGPSWIQFGTEGGFLPAPVVIPAQVTTWVTDPTVFNAGNVDKHSLLLGPAERADVVVDFSQFAGKTLILYNDAPAAFPARDPRYDYYTGNADLRDTGGAPSTLPGYGPNTRTVMQIKVAASAPAPAFNVASLQTAFKATSLGGQGVFQNGQHPIIVGQSGYNSAYGRSFTGATGLVQIFQTSFTFNTLAGVSLTVPLQPKQIQDEMGEAFEKEYGRMSGFLGLEMPGAAANVQNMILYPFINPATEILDGIELPPGASVTPIATAGDGTQIWKITHNGVDTHPIHFHLTDVQLINRVGWDGIIRRPDANELGWKDTVRISPLEDTIVALRPILPRSPFGVPDSLRPLNPMMPLGSTAGFNSTDANGNPITPPITNQIVNFGWEYVWHCHILSHEEMDMMRPMSVIAARALPAAPLLTAAGTPGGPITLSWTDGTVVTTAPSTWGDPAAEIGYRIERALGNAAFQVIGQALANITSFTDGATAAGGGYRYRVVAFNAAGDSPSNIEAVGAVIFPAAPSNLQAALVTGPQVNLTWVDNADNETGFIVERSVDGGAFATLAEPAANTVAYTDSTTQAGHTYAYRVFAAGVSGRSDPSNTATAVTPPAPAAPSNVVLTAQTGPQVRVVFRDNATNETGFVVQRSDNGGPFNTIATLPRRTNVGNVTYFDTAVAAGGSYTYRVAAVNGVSLSAYSPTASVTLPAPPAAPSNFTATTRATSATAARVDLRWQDNSTNETRFVVQRATNATFTTGLLSVNVTANITGFAQTNLPRGTSYYYRIRAENANGGSAWVNASPFPITTP